MTAFTKTFQIKKSNNQVITLDKSGKYQVELSEPGASVEVRGAFLSKDKDAIDVELFIVHRAPHTTAKTVLKGVARDHSSIRFFGRIEIKPNCPGVQSFLEERVLILSEHASAVTVPELEILSDDVKCSHAASISRIPDEHLFYLQSRGLSRAAAEQLIVDGFLTLSANPQAD